MKALADALMARRVLRKRWTGHEPSKPPIMPLSLSFLISFLTLWSAVVWAQQPATGQPRPGREFCDQNVTYRIADPATVLQPYRGFLGAWSDATWDPNSCAALIVDNIEPDGTASIIYVFGPLGSIGRVTGGRLHGTGIIRDGELRFQNSDGTQFAFRPGIADLIGRMTTPSGQSYEAAFKKAL